MSNELETWAVAKYGDEVFEDYEVSSLGRVRSYKRSKTPRILKPRKTRNGYFQVCLCKDENKRFCLVHRLVLSSYQEIPDNWQEMQVNHVSEDKSDNRLVNLEWVTCKQNINHGTRTERSAKALTNGKCSKTVYQFSKSGEFIKEWQSIHEVQRQLGFNQGNISLCCNGKRKTHMGYRWSYEPQLPQTD